LKVQVPPGAIDAPLSEIVRVAPTVVTVPPQAEEVPSATLNPAGSTSVKATPVRVVVVFELVMVNVRVDVPPIEIEVGLKDLAMLGGATTVMLAAAALPLPPLADVTLPVRLFFTPAVAPVTVTLKVQVPPGAIDAPLSEIVPVAATVVTVPPQAEKLPSTTLNPGGSMSVNPTPVSVAVVLALVMVNVRVDVPPTGIAVGLNALLIEGGPTTVMLAEAVLPVPPLVELTLPVVFVKTPAERPVTVTLNMHVLPGAIDAPLSDIVRVAATVVTVPPQIEKLPSATPTPAGSTSVKLTPLSVVELLELLIPKVRVDVPPTGTEFGLNDLVIEGGAMTVILAVAVLPVPPLADVTLPVVFVKVPSEAPVIVTPKVQVPPPAIDAPLSEIVRVAATTVTVPPQAEKLPSATLSPVGRTSVKATPVRAVDGLLFVIVNVRVDVPPTGIEAGLNDLVIEGGPATLMVAVAVLPVPPSVDVTFPVVLV
jgi:hypothetical protein